MLVIHVFFVLYFASLDGAMVPLAELAFVALCCFAGIKWHYVASSAPSPLRSRPRLPLHLPSSASCSARTRSWIWMLMALYARSQMLN